MITSVNTEGILTSGYQSSVGPIIFKSNADRVFKELNLDSIRFPGGNLGNLYHPFKKGSNDLAPGYGFRTDEFPKNTSFYNIYAEWDKTQTENMIYPFMRWLNNIGVKKVLYVANVKNGNIKEISWVINTFLTNGFEIIGIELGNELYFGQWGSWSKNILGQWKSTLMTPEEYIRMAVPVSDFLKLNYPNIKQAIIGWHNGGYTDKAVSSLKSNEWNDKISKSNIKYDAYVVHDYLRIETTDSSSTLSSLMNNVLNLTKYKSSNYLTNINRYFSQYFKDKESWWTEVNVEDPSKMIGNTIIHGAIMMEVLCESHYQKVDLFCFHNLTNTIIGMSMTWSPKNATRVNITSFYHTNIMLSKVKNYNTSVKTSSDGEFHTWQFKEGNKNILCFVNKTNVTRRLFLDKSINKVYVVQGDLHSSNFSDSDSTLDPAYRVNSKKNWTLAEFKVINENLSVNYFDASCGYGVIEWED